MDFYKFIIQLSNSEIPFYTFISEYFYFYNFDIITIKNNIKTIQETKKEILEDYSTQDMITICIGKFCGEEVFQIIKVEKAIKIINKVLKKLSSIKKEITNN